MENSDNKPVHLKPSESAKLNRGESLEKGKMEKTAEQEFQNCRDQIAKERKYLDYSAALRDFYTRDAVHEAIEFTDAVNKLYASQQCAALKEELERVKELSEKRFKDVTYLLSEERKLKEKNERLREALKSMVDATGWHLIPSDIVSKAVKALNHKTS